MRIEYLEIKSKEIRQKVLDYHFQSRVSHLGSSLSCIEIIVALYYDIMNPEDSFILSKGHACSSLYVVLNDKGLIPDDQLFALEEHPTLNKTYGIEATTGSLGHGLSIGLGMSLADKKGKTYVLMSDGECDEGQVWEAVRLASQLKANNLIAIIDCNGWQAFQKTDYSRLDAKFSAFGWEFVWCDGHSMEQLLGSITLEHKNPLVVLAKTIKGKGIKELEDTLESHYVILNKPIQL